MKKLLIFAAIAITVAVLGGVAYAITCPPGYHHYVITGVHYCIKY